MSTSTTSEPMPYRLQFLPEALEEWRSLDGSVRDLLKKALRKRLAQPHLPGAELHAELRHCYKIKLRRAGYRLVYAVEDDVLIVLVLAIGKREAAEAYRSALQRLQSGKPD
ncbi:MAG: type II toxin-antitoxin system RelE/ParE family toxin [Rhodocyclaceae bacterium]|nr:type II toxin-antitoxin system RelE/ParE family toxin [Rhodocyclaceae bacterium]